MLLDLNRPQIKSESLFIPPWTWNILDNSSQELNLRLWKGIKNVLHQFMMTFEDLTSCLFYSAVHMSSQYQ